MMPASQDYRDGATNGAAIMAYRAKVLSIWGVKITDDIMQQLSRAVQYEYGGVVMEDTWGVGPSLSADSRTPDLGITEPKVQD